MQPGLEDSIASSSYMMSSAGKDLSQSKSKLEKMQGKTHIQVGALNYSATKKT